MKKVQLNEGLFIQKGDDGYWLGFESPDGKRAIINLNNMVEGKRIVKSAVLGWAEHTLKEEDPF